MPETRSESLIFTKRSGDPEARIFGFAAFGARDAGSSLAAARNPQSTLVPISRSPDLFVKNLGPCRVAGGRHGSYCKLGCSWAATPGQGALGETRYAGHRLSRRPGFL